MISLEDAIILATQLHAGVLDKQRKPYILHPLRVMLTLPPHLQIPGVLHDVLEDCDITFTTLAEQVDSLGVMNILQALTHLDNEPRRAYIARVCEHSGAVKVKLADIRDNLNRVYGLENPDRERLIAKYSTDLHNIQVAGYDLDTGERF